MGWRAFEPMWLLFIQLNRKTVEIQIDYGSGATLKHKGHDKIDFEMLINISDIVHTITEIQHLFTKKIT